MEIKYKQFVIVPKKPRMSKGKIASQVAHATFMALEKQRKQGTKCVTDKDGKKTIGALRIKAWKENGMCVIVLECESQIELMNFAKYCEQWKIPGHLYVDEGVTEIPPGTVTCFATGVVPEEKFWMFSQFKLFKENGWGRFKW